MSFRLQVVVQVLNNTFVVLFLSYIFFFCPFLPLVRRLFLPTTMLDCEEITEEKESLVSVRFITAGKAQRMFKYGGGGN